MRALVVVILALHLRHGFHGPTIDYAGLAAAAAVSWIGVLGPGESVLIATSIIAAHQKLDIVSVLLVAWVGAVVGGAAGWAIGFKAGRAFVTGPGPLRRVRERAVRHGDRVYERWPVLAIMLTPTWISGIHHVRPALYFPINALSAAVWAVGIGLGAFYLGPKVIDFLDDVGLVAGVLLGGLVAAGLASEFGWRRRRRRRRDAPTSPEP